jgi:cation diffusion facilitator family transporter
MAHDDARSLRTTLVVYVVIFAGKLAAYLASGVMALLAEAFHTLSDIFVSGFLLVALLYSRRSPDKRYLFGYGRAQYVAALVAATLFISFTSFELYKESIPRLFARHEVQYQNVPLALGALIASMVVAAYPLVQMLREKPAGAAAKAQLLELVNDELGLLAALIGTACVLRGFPIADPIATLVVATIIAINAIGLFRENAAYLLGRSPPPEVLAAIEAAARTIPGVFEVHDIRAEFIGPDVLHADVHVRVLGSLTVVEGHAIARAVDRALEPVLGNGICEVHVDPLESRPTVPV